MHLFRYKNCCRKFPKEENNNKIIYYVLHYK